MKKILITGADGFIGRHLVDALLDESVEIYAIVYPGNNIYHNKKTVLLHVVEMDLNQYPNYISFFPNDIDTMYHFAWQGISPESRNRFEIQSSNLALTISCLHMAKELGISKIIFPGSTNEYLYYGKPINKYALPSPSNAYGATKVALRYLCSSFCKEHDIEFIYAIITGIYASDRRDSNVIYYTIDKLLAGKKPSLSKLEQLWDYVYIDDAVRALIAIGNYGINEAVYAIGHGDNWPLRNYIETIHDIINSSIPLGIGEIPYASETLPSSCVDLTDLTKDTGFTPTIDFPEGISKVISQIKKERQTN